MYRTSRRRRARAAAFAAALAGAVMWAGCGRSTAAPGDASPEASASAASGPVEEPASGDVVAMLDGLKRGDLLEGFSVEHVGAVRADGGVPLRLERDKETMLLLVTLLPPDDVPRPPARTSKYAVYYETVSQGVAAREEDCQRVAKALAKRIEGVEDKVPTPPGMKEPRRAGQPA